LQRSSPTRVSERFQPTLPSVKTIEATQATGTTSFFLAPAFEPSILWLMETNPPLPSIVSVRIAIAAFIACFTACKSTPPHNLGGDRAKTAVVDLNRSDCKLVLGRASGTDQGFKLLGLIPLKSASESTAVDKMYENAKSRGVALEGNSRVFANTSVERSSNYFILFSIPSYRSTGDVVEYIGTPPSRASR
jgi:hypothetical protein